MTLTIRELWDPETWEYIKDMKFQEACECDFGLTKEEICELIKICNKNYTICPEVYILFESQDYEYSCKKCKQWQDVDDLILDSYSFYCSNCGRYNFIDSLSHSIEEDTFRYVNYQMQDKVYLFNLESYQFDDQCLVRNRDSFYDDWFDWDNPVRNLRKNQMLIRCDYVFRSEEEIPSEYKYVPYCFYYKSSY